MGWFATYKALKDGTGPYGDVAQSLKGEADPPRTLGGALHKIDQEIASGSFSPDKEATVRIATWRGRLK